MRCECRSSHSRAFAEKWDGRFPPIERLWRAAGEHVIPLFAFPAPIRKVIYTTNAIESLNASLRNVIQKRGAFPNGDVVRKVLYLAIQRVAVHWNRPLADWPAALSQFAMMFPGRVTM